MILVVLTFTGLDSGVAGGSGYVRDHLGQSWGAVLEREKGGKLELREHFFHVLH